MIKQSFIILDSVTENKERKLWQLCKDWNQFLSSEEELTKDFMIHKNQIEDAKKALYDFDQTHFTKLLPPSMHWRLYDHFKDDAVFLDIETTGFRGGTTVVGLYDGKDTHILVRDQTLDSKTLQNLIDRYKLIVTFNGASFDLPVLRNEYGIDFTKHLHMDLRGVCRKVGLTGGLKNIEKETGISRDDDVEGISGADAVVLWKKYKKTGDEQYLNLLVKYNEEDIINLKPLADMVVPKLWEQVRNL
ncbi:exonuclease [Candidatus Woesearchaeota archaeon]|nr:MAG: exonuclease [Candidatus Woesearchaeota archaeon]